MPIYTDRTFLLQGQRNVVKEIESVLVDQGVVVPYRTRNNVVDFEAEDAGWYMRLTDEFVAKREKGLAAKSSDNSPEPTPDDSNQEPVDNNESEISQPAASEETRLDRDSNV